MLDALVGMTFDRKGGGCSRFTVTGVDGSKVLVIDGDARPSTISVWSLMRSWNAGEFHQEKREALSSL
jgi:hypothetical protein